MTQPQDAQSAETADVRGPFGTVRAEGNSVIVSATSDHLRAWANRPGAVWPCSELTMLDRIAAWIDRDSGDLVDLSVDPDGLSSAELTAWIDDSLAGTPWAHLARNPETERCYCPGDCNCRHSGAPYYRPNLCGCKRHPEAV